MAKLRVSNGALKSCSSSETRARWLLLLSNTWLLLFVLDQQNGVDFLLMSSSSFVVQSRGAAAQMGSLRHDVRRDGAFQSWIIVNESFARRYSHTGPTITRLQEKILSRKQKTKVLEAKIYFPSFSYSVLGRQALPIFHEKIIIVEKGKDCPRSSKSHMKSYQNNVLDVSPVLERNRTYNKCSKMGSNVPMNDKPPSKRKVRPLIKPLEIPQPPPTAFDLFYEEEKQKWSQEYRQNLLDSCMSHARLEKRMRRALALRWKSLTEDERKHFEDRAKQQSECFQHETARYKYITGQLNPKYLYSVNKDGIRVNSIDWSKQMAPPPPKKNHRVIKQGIDPKQYNASLLLHSRFGKKQAPMSPPPPILAPPPPIQSAKTVLPPGQPRPTLKTAPIESSFPSAWAVVNSFDHQIDRLIRDIAGSV